MTRRQAIVTGCMAVVGLAGCGRKAPEASSLTQTEIQEFQAALDEGDALVVDRLLQAKPALVNVPDATGRTPLKAAEDKGNTELADVLRRHGGHR